MVIRTVNHLLASDLSIAGVWILKSQPMVLRLLINHINHYVRKIFLEGVADLDQ